LTLVGDLAQEKRDLDEAQRTVERLDALLDAPNRVEVFPNLLEGVLQALEARAIARRRARSRSTRPSATPALRSRSRLHAAARGSPWLGVALRRHPANRAGAQQRDKQVDAQLRELDKAGFALNVQIHGLEAQLAAIEKFVEDTVEVRGNTGGEKAVYLQISRELTEARALRDEYEQLSRTIEVARLKVGVNDEASSEDEKVRQQLSQALDAEEAYLSSRGACRGRPPKRSRISAARRESRRVPAEVGRRGRREGRRAEASGRARAPEHEGLHGGELATYQGQTESLGGTIAARSFRTVHERVDVRGARGRRRHASTSRGSRSRT
jgi:hypothetical protein